MNLTIEVVPRDMLQTLLGLERSFIERHAEQCGDIPAMPRLVMGERCVKYHLPSVRAWLLEHFQTGGK